MTGTTAAAAAAAAVGAPTRPHQLWCCCSRAVGNVGYVPWLALVVSNLQAPVAWAFVCLLDGVVRCLTAACQLRQPLEYWW